MRPIAPPCACLLVLVAGCGGGDTAKAPAPQSQAAASTLTGRPPPLGRGLVFRRGEVDAVLTPTRFRARVSDSPLPVPRGRRAVRLAVRWRDRGREPFPFEWARFALAGRVGKVRPESARTPVRRLSPTEDRSPRATVLAFVVPHGFRPAQLRVSSAVAAWRFRARWRIPGGG